VYSCDAFDHVARLARQDGNVTGDTCMTSELSAKRLELLKEAVPTASRIVFLSEPEDSPSGLKRAQDAAPGLGIKLTTVGFKSRGELPRALEMVAKERPDAGGLMSYSSNALDMFRLLADQTARIFDGKALGDDHHGAAVEERPARRVPMSSVARAALIDAAARRERTDDPSEPVFRAAYRRTARALERAAEAAQATLRPRGRTQAVSDGYTWHGNRHTFASRLVMADVDLRAVQELGGWKILSMVQR
jgi:Phage integrase family